MLAWLVVGLYGLSLVVIFFYALLQASLAINYLRTKKNQANTLKPLVDFPFVTIQLPIYNEKYVVERLLEQTVKLNWPKDKIEFQIFFVIVNLT